MTYSILDVKPVKDILFKKILKSKICFCYSTNKMYLFVFRVMVLDQGKIVEFKDPNTLLKDKSSVFYGMAKDADIV